MGWFTLDKTALSPNGDGINDFFEDVYDSLENDYIGDIKNYDDAVEALDQVFGETVESYLMYYRDQNKLIEDSSFHLLWDGFCESCDMLGAPKLDSDNLMSFFWYALYGLNYIYGILTVNDEDEELEESCRVRRPRNMRRNGRMLESRRIKRNRR